MIHLVQRVHSHFTKNIAKDTEPLRTFRLAIEILSHDTLDFIDLTFDFSVSFKAHGKEVPTATLKMFLQDSAGALTVDVHLCPKWSSGAFWSIRLPAWFSKASYLPNGLFVDAPEFPSGSDRSMDTENRTAFSSSLFDIDCSHRS